MKIETIQNIINKGEGISYKNATYEFIDGDFFSTIIHLNNKSSVKTVVKTVEKSSGKSSVKGSVKIIDILRKNRNISAFELAQKIGSGLVEKVGSRLAENQMKIYSEAQLAKSCRLGKFAGGIN